MRLVVSLVCAAQLGILASHDALGFNMNPAEVCELSAALTLRTRLQIAHVGSQILHLVPQSGLEVRESHPGLVAGSSAGLTDAVVKR